MLNLQLDILGDESLMFSDPDLEYHLDEWKESKNGKLCITGLTGSGKSTLASKIAKKYNVPLYSIDYFQNHILDRTPINKLMDEEKWTEAQTLYFNETNKYITSVLKKKEKCIIEGIQLFLMKDVESLRQHSVVIKGTSTITSFIRAYKRNRKAEWNKEWSIWETIEDIIRNIYGKELEEFVKLVKKWVDETEEVPV